MDTTPAGYDTPVVGARLAFSLAAAARYDIVGTGGASTAPVKPFNEES